MKGSRLFYMKINLIIFKVSQLYASQTKLEIFLNYKGYILPNYLFPTIPIISNIILNYFIVDQLILPTQKAHMEFNFLQHF